MRAADKRRDNVFHPIEKKAKTNTFVQILYIFTSARLNWWPATPVGDSQTKPEKSQEDMQRDHPPSSL